MGDVAGSMIQAGVLGRVAVNGPTRSSTVRRSGKGSLHRGQNFYCSFILGCFKPRRISPRCELTRPRFLARWRPRPKFLISSNEWLPGLVIALLRADPR